VPKEKNIRTHSRALLINKVTNINTASYIIKQWTMWCVLTPFVSKTRSFIGGKLSLFQSPAARKIWKRRKP
jgi:hypothetical protein